MRQKRAKAYEKLMTNYERYFNFRKPYQILIDDEFSINLFRANLDPQKQLDMVMRGPCKIMITQCAIHALYLKGKDFQPVVDLTKTYERRKCNHKEPKEVNECIKDVVGDSNKHRYIIASTNNTLRRNLHRVPGVPILHYNRMVIVLEPPSKVTNDKISELEGQKISQSLVEKDVLAKEDGEGNISGGDEKQLQQPPKRKRKGPKGPNPLSAKKKSKSNQGQPSNKQSKSNENNNHSNDLPKKKKNRRRNNNDGNNSNHNNEQEIEQ